MDEQSEVARLLEEIRDLQAKADRERRIQAIGRDLQVPVDVDAGPREYALTIRGRSFDVERDESGRIKRVVGPEGTKTLIRDEQGMVTRIDEEMESVE